MTEKYAPDSFYSIVRLVVTLFIAIIGNAGMWAIVVIMPEIEGEFQISRATLSFPYILTMVGFALGNVFLGRFVDRIGITQAIIFASFLNMIGFVG